MKRETWLLGFLAVVSFGVFYYLRAPFGGDWDSQDFVWQIVVHRHSNLGFGRLYYIAYNIPIWEVATWLLNLSRVHAYQVIQCATLCLGSGALIIYYLILKRLLNVHVAWLSTILLMTSPFYVTYAGFIMTEIPMFFFLLLGLLFHLKGLDEGKLGWVALGSALFGVTVGVRENALVFTPLFLALPFIRSRNRCGHGWKVLACTILPALAVGIAGPLWLIWRYPVDYPMYVKYWLSKVPRTRVLDWTLLRYLVMYMFLNTPIGAVLFVPALIELLRRGYSRLRAASRDSGRRTPDSGPSGDGPIYNASYGELLAFSTLLVIVPYLALLMDSDMQYYARYAIIGVPGLTMLAGLYINNSAARLQAGWLWKYGLTVGLSGVLLLIGASVIEARNKVEQRRKDILDHLYECAPENAVFLPGRLTPMIEGYRQMGLRPQWEMISSGWPWPGREGLAARVSQIIQARRPLYLITDYSVWHFLDNEQADINDLRNQFQFQKIDNYLEKVQADIEDLSGVPISPESGGTISPEPGVRSPES